MTLMLLTGLTAGSAGLPGWRSGKLLILRLTARGFWRFRLETTRS